MYNNYWRVWSVLTHKPINPTILQFECPRVSFAYEGEFILEAEYWETFPVTQNQEMPGRVHSASHNLLIL